MLVFLKCDHTISEALCCEITAELNLPSSAPAVAADAIVSISISRLPPTSPTRILTRSSHKQIKYSLRRGERTTWPASSLNSHDPPGKEATK